MATTAAEGEMTLKLHIVVDKKKNRVAFAEAKKEFVDLILHILTLPLGAVQRILTNTSILGSIGSLSEGLKYINDAEFTDNIGKKYLLDAVEAPYYLTKQDRMVIPQISSRCHNCSSKPLLLREPCICGSYRSSRGYVSGYVNGMVTFMVLDDLTVVPATPASVFSVMRELSIKDVDATEKRVVTFGPNQAISLLKASLSSKTVLTDVFLLRGAVKVEK